jgi:hypothetical protein
MLEGIRELKQSRAGSQVNAEEKEACLEKNLFSLGSPPKRGLFSNCGKI